MTARKPQNLSPTLFFWPIFSIFGETQAKSALCKTNDNNDDIQHINTNSSISLIKILNPTTTAKDKRLKIRTYLRRWSWRRPGETCRVLLLVPLVGSENLEWQVMEGQLWMKGGYPPLELTYPYPKVCLKMMFLFWFGGICLVGWRVSRNHWLMVKGGMN